MKNIIAAILTTLSISATIGIFYLLSDYNPFIILLMGIISVVTIISVVCVISVIFNWFKDLMK